MICLLHKTFLLILCIIRLKFVHSSTSIRTVSYTHLLAVIDYEKVIDRVDRSILCDIMCTECYPKHVIIKILYYKAVFSIGDDLAGEILSGSAP